MCSLRLGLRSSSLEALRWLLSNRSLGLAFAETINHLRLMHRAQRPLVGTRWSGHTPQWPNARNDERARAAPHKTDTDTRTSSSIFKGAASLSYYMAAAFNVYSLTGIL
jgi:hypothetical protein